MNTEPRSHSELAGDEALWYPALMDQVQQDAVILPQRANSVGTWRRFGAVGPIYEIVGAGRESPNGDYLMRIRVVESGEEVDYRLGDMLDDRRAC